MTTIDVTAIITLYFAFFNRSGQGTRVAIIVVVGISAAAALASAMTTNDVKITIPPPLRPSFITTADGTRLAYHLTNSKVILDDDSSSSRSSSLSSPVVIFCCGFRSSMDGSKALFLEQYCSRRHHENTSTPRGVSFCRFDYRGHGQSQKENKRPTTDTEKGKGGEQGQNQKDSGDLEFAQMTLSDWIDDTERVLQHVVGEDESGRRPVILVGSSMGAWIALHIAKKYPHRVMGLLGIAPAPDFLNDIWTAATPEQRRQWSETDGVVYLPTEYEDRPYPISRKLIEDAQKNWLLLDPLHQDATIENPWEKAVKKIDINCPVRFVHGQADMDVSYAKALQITDRLAADDVVVTLVKDGDHRLSRPKDLKRITSILDELIDTVMLNIESSHTKADGTS